MNNNFDLEIITPTSSQKIKVEWIEVEGISGCFLVGPRHSPLVSVIKKGNSLVYSEAGAIAPKEMFIGGGIFSVNNNKAMAIVDI